MEMTWYKAYYGSWKDADGVQFIRGSFSHKEILDAAQRVANKTGAVVTIMAERGMRLNFEEVRPQK